MKVLVFGFYNNHNNAGDDFFIDAFKKLFPDYKFTFTDLFSASLINDADVIFIGGGSFLQTDLEISDDDFKLLKSKPIYYIGVGVEDKISNHHSALLKLSRHIYTRSLDKLDHLKTNINTNTSFLPDIVYSLSPNKSNTSINKSVLILPNAYTVPSNSDVFWKHAAWNYFKSEFSQFLDQLTEEGFTIHFQPLSTHYSSNDNGAAFELINMMKNKNYSSFPNINNTFNNLTNLISKYTFIITQRYHGIVLSELCEKPYLAISHHDKIKNSSQKNGQYLSYYNSNKQSYLDSFFKLKDYQQKSIKSDIFEDFVKEIRKSITLNLA